MERLNVQSNTSVIKAVGTFKDCLSQPKFYLARIPQAVSKTVVCKIVRNFTITANPAGNLAFIFVPQAINDVVNLNGTSPFWLQNQIGYTPTTTEVATGYTGFAVGSIINNAFSSARCISACIELVPNVSLTTAVGRGVIAMSKVLTVPLIRMGPTETSTVNYSRLQLQDTMMASPYVSTCEVSKMQGLTANWLPHEAVDILDFPTINFSSSSDLANRHPSENFVYGLFTGLPASATVNVRTYTNVELIPDSSLSNSGLFPLIAEFSQERTAPLLALRDTYVQQGNMCMMLDANGAAH
jgi:hypothetical protein